MYKADNNCLQCKSEMFCKQKYRIDKQKFCSFSCRTIYYNTGAVFTIERRSKISKANTGKFVGDKSPTWKGEHIPCVCKLCQKHFKIPKDQFERKKRKGVFCSIPCYSEFKKIYSVSPEQKKLTEKVKSRLYDLLRTKIKNNVEPKSYIFEYLSFTIDELYDHLQSKFTEGMSWENHGKWHLDHKKPLSYFKYTSIEDDDFKKCWELENLQPLWADDNNRKGGANTLVNQKIYGTK